MSRVVQVVQHLRPGGIETMALDLCSFTQGKNKPLIISLEGSCREALQHWPRLKRYASRVIFLNKQPGIKPFLVLRLSRLLRRIGADVVHTHHLGPLLYAGLAARLAGIKHLIHTEHDAWHLNDPRHCRLQKTIIRLTQPLLVADAHTVASAMCRQLNIDKVEVVTNGIDTEYFKPGQQSLARKSLALPQNVPLIGCSGRLEAVKGHHFLFEALRDLPQDVHLALAGEGSMKQALERLAEELGLSRRIHFLGRVDYMPRFYQALDVFCLPSINEGMPLSPLEAQACNVPTLVTDVGAASETLCPDTGVLIPAKDVDALSLNLLRVLNAQLKMHSATAPPSPRTFVQQHCDVRLMAQAYSQLQTREL
ncbi:glycosyl transferase [Gammaproteobacteria bacterium 53_120_T64]|nr:glycosyl transferase [Gammaproteobacteria bacterium 53_120_T64]